tara:strand:- start:263 stop:1408 length:1146 start_codon:yes stop_codon:yes gene_type:complete
MTTEKQILQDKIQGMIVRKSDHNATVCTQITEESKNLKDFIVPIGVQPRKNIGFDISKKFSADFLTSVDVVTHIAGKLDGEQESYNLHPHAVSQLGARFGIPSGYIKGLAQGSIWNKELCADMLESYSANSDSRRLMFRSVGNEVRGVMSDHYRRLNTSEIYASFIEEVSKHGGMIYDSMIDDTRTYINTILPNVVEIPTEKNGTVYAVFGLRVSNSDFGDGALVCRAYQMQVVCMNGMTSNNLLRQIHLGKKLPDNLVLSDATYQLDTQTQASLIKDIVSNVYSSEYILGEANKVQQASNMSLDMSKEIKTLSKIGILKNEVEEIQQTLIENNAEKGVTGESTLWKLSQAMTSIAQTKSQRRQQEIEDITGKLVTTKITS